jgi:four helix bundle protein
MKILRSHKELDVYQLAFKTSMEIFHISQSFPKDELFSLTSQIRRSSRSVSANIAEAFRKRRYEMAFISKLSDSEAEAANLRFGLITLWNMDTYQKLLMKNYSLNMIISLEK